jgi:CPA2 family monovalent cation:H+ antiporter-2
MPHETPLIATIVIGLGLAFVLGAIANRFRIPPLVGYLVAGILVGPFTPGFVADQTLAPQLAEIGVILLMFGVGLHFSLTDLLSVKAIALPGAIVQIAIATAMGSAIAWWLGWTPAAGLVFGLALSVASTVVLLRALQERRILETERGRIAVGWLIVEDLAMVLALVLLPALAQIIRPGSEVSHADPVAGYLGYSLWGVVILTLVKVALFVALMLVVGRKLIPWLLHYVAHTGSRELFRLAVLAIALGVAFGAAKLFGVSLALGAFFAGMILSESQLSHRAAEESLPLRDAFAVLFFVSAGMLFNPISLLRDPLPMMATLFVIVVGKSLAAFLIVLAFRHPLMTALTISASLAQIGEFSFILADVGRDLGLIPAEARDLILAGAILSIMLNPLAFTAVDLLNSRFAKTPQAGVADAAAIRDDGFPVTRLSHHTVLVGHGRVGSIVSEALREKRTAFLVIEDASSRIAELREKGIEVIPAHAAKMETLVAANIAGASLIILAIPNSFEAGRVVEFARGSNPGIRIIARAHSDEEVDYLTKLGADIVIMGEREIAHGMIAALETATPAGPDGIP